MAVLFLSPATNIHQVYFWTAIRKNRAKYNLIRGISEDEITKILLYELICGRDVMSAESQLSKLSGIRKFIDRLQTEREKEDFRKHMRKYINMWLPESPFEVSTTNRYTIVTHEAAVFARREIRKGETIKYLCGTLVAITAEEELDLDLTRRDFSIVMSSRKKTPSLFLGPARFANHDCSANARLVTVGSDGMQVVAVRYIDQDEEITVTYGDDYFGVDNCECLCSTCELNQRNGWTPPPSSSLGRLATPQMQEESTGPYSFRRKRKFGTSGLVSPAPTLDAEEGQSSKRSRSILSSSGASTPVKPHKHRSILAETLAARLGSNEATKNELFSSTGLDCAATEIEANGPVVMSTEEDIFATNDQGTTPDEVAVGKDLAPAKLEESSAGLSGSSALTAISFGHHETDGDDEAVSIPKLEGSTETITATTSDPISLDGPTVKLVHTLIDSSDTETASEVDLVQTYTPSSTPDSSRFRDLFLLNRGLDLTSSPAKIQTDVEPPPIEVNTIISEEIQVTVEVPVSSDINVYDSDSELSGLSANEEFDDVNLCVIRKSKAKARAAKKVAKLHDNTKADIQMPVKRYPEDYVRTSLLLGEPYSRWVDCSTCSRSWVQQNGYYTRRECPRCERHSKLYGYQWPKTEKFKGDGERIIDHRTVHRFLYPDEEANIKKKNRGLRPDFSVAAAALPSPPSSQAEDMKRTPSETEL